MAYDPHASRSRVHVEETPAGTRITLRGKPQWFAVGFLGLWLCGWLAGEVFAIVALVIPGTPVPARLFLLVWLVLWTLGGLAAIRHAAAAAAGTDVLVLASGGPLVGKRVLGFERLRKIDLASLLAARVIRGMGRSVWLIIPPSDGHRVSRIGAGLDAEEAEGVVVLIREWAERQERLAGRSSSRTDGARTEAASSASPRQGYLFYRPMEFSTNRRGEDADEKRERSVGGGTQGR